MNFKVISQSTNEREQETIDLFNKTKPYLDEGFSYRLALQKVLGKNQHVVLAARVGIKTLWSMLMHMVIQKQNIYTKEQGVL